ncbi:hypothetical protein ACFFRR_003915 [Megaselia abdita]
MTTGSNKADHYGSVIFRALIDYDTKEEKVEQKSLIIKTTPFVEGNQKEFLEGMNLFDTEIKMYNEVIPKFEKILSDEREHRRIGAKCLYASTNPHYALIFEDLGKQNYKTASNWGGSWEIGKIAVEKLAMWHAMSFKLVNEGDQDLQSFSKNVYSEDKLYESPMFKHGFPNFVEMLKKQSDLEIYVSKFEKLLSEDPKSKVKALYNFNINDNKANWVVLNHGDFHIKNLMFLEKVGGKVEDVLLVDYQLSIWGPAVIDLTYLVYTILDDESRITRRNEIIHHYFETFTETLQKIKFNGDFPKLTDLYKDFITYKDLGTLKFFVLNGK